MSFATSTPGGRITLLIAWITPFEASTSATTIAAPLIVNPSAAGAANVTSVHQAHGLDSASFAH
jgi:hypothetical protein